LKSECLSPAPLYLTASSLWDGCVLILDSEDECDEEFGEYAFHIAGMGFKERVNAPCPRGYTSERTLLSGRRLVGSALAFCA
jgi:hypothetical protein